MDGLKSKLASVSLHKTDIKEKNAIKIEGEKNLKIILLSGNL